MHHLNLAGDWTLSQDGGAAIAGKLPGCTYLDYMKNGMPDPFWGENETAAKEIAYHDYTYSRKFNVPAQLLEMSHIDLVAQGLDTLCTITINGKAVAETDNINRTWRINVKELLRIGENRIALDFKNPYPYFGKRQNAEPMKGGMSDGKGAAYLRKTASHFGWDWGPALAPAGIIGSIEIQGYETRIEDFIVIQRHDNNTVSLEIEAQFTPSQQKEIEARLTLTAPDGTAENYQMIRSGNVLRCHIGVVNPQIWWCNGLGAQPLYQLALSVISDNQVADTQIRKIGLRTIEMDTRPDAMGAQFRFIVNGVPIFAKGTNWIPADSFITRTTSADIDFYVKSASRANMNMLRVWGGGMYESEAFYDACDRYGILVWQDFLFACGSYPFYNDAFVQNIHAEVKDNVRRIRHHASLAVWCGNNEVEIFALLWNKNGKLYQTNLPFYHNTLSKWVKELDRVTPYWPGSPSAGKLGGMVQSMKKGKQRGDSHLWQIWHGMLPIEAFRRYPTRFCSEFGMESMPSMHTIRSFTDGSALNLFDPVMQLHQKCRGGNEKMLFYLLAKYRNPAKFEDFVYLSQLVQANTVRFATDCWRRHIGHSNGSIFWQLNDCWPVASWSAIDYHKQFKAVMYHARHFNKMICLSNDYFDDRAELYIVNEYPDGFSGTLDWMLHDFSGNLINEGTKEVRVSPVSAAQGEVLHYKEIIKGRHKSDLALTVSLRSGDTLVDEKHWLLVPDKKARLPKVRPQYTCKVEKGVAKVTLSSPLYARYVYLEAEDVIAPWSDNFFDIPAGRSVTVEVALPKGMDTQMLQKRLKVKTLTDVQPKNSLFKDKLLRMAMVLHKDNFLRWFVCKFL